MIKFTENNELDLNVIEVTDIIDLNTLQKFQDNFSLSMNCAAITVDKSGKPITKESSYSKFCISLIQSTNKGCERCAASHRRMGQEAAKVNKPYVGTCHAGLIDFSAPIIIEGRLIGTVLGGQILDGSADINHLRKTAAEIGVNAEKLVSASDDIEKVNRKNIEAAAEVLYIVVNSIAQNGYNSIKVAALSKKLSDNFIQASATIEELSASAHEIATNQENLNNDIITINTLTDNINEILVSIKNIASQVKMLGLNASIEASRAGESGKGFAVVASEIRKLSESSRQTADLISSITDKIHASVDGTINNATTTLSTTKQQSEAMEELNTSIQEAVKVAEHLNQMLNRN